MFKIFISLITLLFPLLLSADNSSIKDIDINSNDIKIKLMGDLEGRSIIFKLKDKDDNNLAVFKPTSGSTFYRGEYASYKLAQLIGLDIYCPTEISYMNKKTQEKVLPLLENTKYSNKQGPEKEENRKIIIEEIKSNIQKGKKLEGALKLWVHNLMFYKPLGSKKGFKTSPIYKHLKANGPQPAHNAFVLSQCTQLFEPKGCVDGWAYRDEVARDMSSILVLDAVLGNSDRFAGGNLHFYSVDGDTESKKGKKIFKKARLFSLDNGAVLMPNNRTGLNTLKELGVTRFVKEHIDKLKDIQKMNDTELRKELGLTPEYFEIFKNNLSLTLEYIDQVTKENHSDVWFKTL